MVSKTIWKVRDAGGEMVGQTVHAEDAAALVALRQIGKITWEHGITVWTEGKEAFPAGESYSAAAEVIHARVSAYRKAALDVMGEGWNGCSRKAGKAGRAAAASVRSDAFAPH